MSAPGFGVRPPNYAKGIEIKNSSSTEVSVTVTFQGSDTVIHKTATIGAGTAKKFDEQVQSMGSYSVVIPVHKFTVSQGGQQQLEHQPAVTEGVVDTVYKEIVVDSSGLSVV